MARKGRQSQSILEFLVMLAAPRARPPSVRLYYLVSDFFILCPTLLFVDTKYRMRSNLFDSDRLRQVTRLVDVRAARQGGVVCQQLQGDHVQDR